jgi:hypothetical protein
MDCSKVTITNHCINSECPLLGVSTEPGLQRDESVQRSGTNTVMRANDLKEIPDQMLANLAIAPQCIRKGSGALRLYAERKFRF